MRLGRLLHTMTHDLLTLRGLHAGATHLLVQGVSNPTRHPLRLVAGAPSTQDASSQYSTSTTTKIARQQRGDLKVLIELDRISFLSGSTKAAMQSAHIVNAKRAAPTLSEDKKGQVALLKQSIVRVLSCVTAQP